MMLEGQTTTYPSHAGNNVATVYWKLPGAFIKTEVKMVDDDVAA